MCVCVVVIPEWSSHWPIVTLSCCSNFSLGFILGRGNHFCTVSGITANFRPSVGGRGRRNCRSPFTRCPKSQIWEHLSFVVVYCLCLSQRPAAFIVCVSSQRPAAFVICCCLLFVSLLRGLLFFSDVMNKWAVPFPGADKAVVRDRAAVTKHLHCYTVEPLL